MRKRPASAGRRLVRFIAAGALALVALLAGWVGWSMHRVGQRQELMTRIELSGGEVVPPDGTTGGALAGRIPFAWRLCGAKPVWWLLLPEGFNDVQQTRVRRLFPEARVARVNDAPHQPG